MPAPRLYLRLVCLVVLASVLAFLPAFFLPENHSAVRAATMSAVKINTAKISTAPMGLHVAGQQLLDETNHPLILRGVNRSGSEYACIQGWGFFDGPSDLASVQAMASWGANAVRIPMNEDCWLNINGAPPAYAGAAYHTAIASYVATVQAAGLVPILELHWTGAGTTRATGQQPMLNRDHSVDFWQQVADAYRSNTGVIFDLHNEPYPDNNFDTAAAWDCWKNGTTATNAAVCPGSGLTYQAAGMQEIVNAVRATGATNPIMLGGVQYANALSRWLTYQPQDPAGNLIAAWHVYNFNICSSVDCYNATAAPVAAAVPLVTGEIGENDCGTGMMTTLMSWLDAHNSGYLAWTWDTWGTACVNFSLITDYAGTPTAYGQAFKDHLTGLQATPTATSTQTPGTPTPTPTGTWNTATATPTGTTTSTPAPPTSTQVVPTPTQGPGGIYDDLLLNQWVDWSWGTRVNPASTAYVHSGTHAMSVQYTGAWGGLQVGQGNTFNTGSYTTVSFWINGGEASGQQISAFVQYRNGTTGPTLPLDAYIAGGGIEANTWRLVTIPLSDLGAADTSIYTLNLQDATGSMQPAYYVDDWFFSPGGSGSPTPTSTPTIVSEQVFVDVPLGAPFYDQINWCYDRSIISGYSNGDGTLSFRPANNSTRAQVSKILVNAEGWSLVTPGTPHFLDVPLTHPFYPYVETAYSHGMISGYSDGTFSPQNTVTRGQIAKMLVQAQGWSPDTSDGPHFTDVPVTNGFYTYIETAYHHNVVSGYADGTFRPINNVTRGQLAKLVHGMTIAR